MYDQQVESKHHNIIYFHKERNETHEKNKLIYICLACLIVSIVFDVIYMISSKDEMFIATNIAMFIVFIPIAYKKIFKK